MAVFTGNEAAHRARTMFLTGFKGMCLQRVRLIYNVAARYGSAQTAWNNAQRRHPLDRNIPIGAPVFWSINSGANRGLGHVAVYLGDGLVSSTTVNNGNPGIVGLDALTKAWGITYLGWSEDINGVTVVPTIPGTDTPSSGDNTVDNIVEEIMASGFVRVRDEQGAVRLATASGGFVGIPDPEFNQVVQDVLGAPQVQVNNRQRDIISNMMQRIREQAASALTNPRLHEG